MDASNRRLMRTLEDQDSEWAGEVQPRYEPDCPPLGGGAGREDDDWDDGEDGEDRDDEGFKLSAGLMVMLSWKEAGRLEVEDDDEGIDLRVDGRPVDPPNSRNRQAALVSAFREQMDENYVQLEEGERRTARYALLLCRNN